MARCARCGKGQQHQERVEITSMGDASRQFMLGRWDQCPVCGWTGPPVAFQAWPALDRPVLNPMPPTPMEMLLAAGLSAWAARLALGIPEPEPEYDPDEDDWDDGRDYEWA